MIWTRINFKILNATKQPLETVSSSSYEENIAIKLQESFPKYLSCSAVVTLEEMCLRTKLSEDPMHKGENNKKDNVNNGTIAELLFQQFFLSFSRLFYTLCICSLTEFYFGCSNTFKSLAFGVYKANSYWVWSQLNWKNRGNFGSNLGFSSTLIYHISSLRNNQS